MNNVKTYCFVTSHYLPYLGGVERYTYNLSKKLVERGNNVIIVTSQMEGQPERLEENGIEIIRTDAIPYMKDRLPLMKLSKNNKKIIKYLVEKKIDYIIVNTKFYPITLWGVRFAKKNHIPAIVIEHGTGHLEFAKRKIVDKIGEQYEHFMAFLMKGYCKNFVGVSEECTIWLKHFRINAIGVLYNAIDYEHIEQIIPTNSKYDSNTVVYTGRILKEKGITKLIQAVKELEKEGNEIKLIVVGDGPILQEIKEDCKGFDITFTGRVDFEEVIRLLCEGSIYCFPTDYPEGLPTCVLEAMACGLYSITSSSGGAKEVIINDNYGKILVNNSVDEIKNAIQEAMTRQDNTKEIAINGKNRVKEFFTWDKTCDNLIKMFREIENEN